MQRLFLTWARPVAPALCLVAYGIFALVRPETNAERILPLLGLSVLAGIGYGLAARRFGAEPVLRVLLVVDTLLLAAMTAALARPDELAIAYFWSIGLAAFFFGARETLGTTVLATVCVATVPSLGDFGSDPVVVFTDAIVVALIGGLLALLSSRRRDAEDALRVESELDASALRIAEQVRSSLDVEEVLNAAVAELGHATGSDRVLLRLVQPFALHQWVRDGLEPVEPARVESIAVRRGPYSEPFRVERLEDAPDESVAGFMRDFGVRSLLAYPLVWQDEPLAVLSLHRGEPRRWGPELALLERVGPQLAAALVQARAFEQLREVALTRERLIANVSHELRTPLTSTLGFLQTLERGDLELSHEERAAFVAVAREQAERLAALVEDLLTLARIESRGAQPREQAAEVGTAVSLAARELTFADRRLSLEIERDLRVRADERRLVQIFSNLLGNALVHGAGEIRVRGRREAGWVEIEVADDGPPIPAERHEEIFVPFARWNESAVGTGLGLPISRSLAEAHGGSVVYDGSAFVVRLPEA